MKLEIKTTIETANKINRNIIQSLTTGTSTAPLMSRISTASSGIVVISLGSGNINAEVLVLVTGIKQPDDVSSNASQKNTLMLSHKVH